MFSEYPLVLGVLLLWLVFSLLLAPLEALGWWAGWIEGDEESEPEVEPPDKPAPPENVQAYVVYLTGISGVSGEDFLPEEVRFLNELDIALPQSVVVKDLYPYSPANRALTGQRTFARFWRFAQQMKMGGRPLQRFIGFLINIRNLFQVMVSADRRYGPIYNSIFARAITQALLRHGYERGSGTPVYVLGYSGGGQMAVGSAQYLKKMVNAPVSVISLGGALSGDPGVMELEHLYHLYGKRDGVQQLAYIMSPSRWHIGRLGLLPQARWHQARQGGRMSFIYVGDMRHNGQEGYLDPEYKAADADAPNLTVVVDIISRLVHGNPTKQPVQNIY